MKPNRQWVVFALTTLLLAQGCQEDAPPLPITVSGTASPGGLFSSPEPYILPFSVDAPSMVYINMQDDFISTPNRWNVTLGADYTRDVSGSFFETVSLPAAGNYEFVINCRNTVDTCRFTTTLSSTPPLVYDPGQEIANDGVYQAPFSLSEPATVRYWLDDNFMLTMNGWRVAIVMASDVDAFVGGAEPTAYGSFAGMGPTNATVELPLGDYALVVACTNTIDPCRFDTAVVVN